MADAKTPWGNLTKLAATGAALAALGWAEAKLIARINVMLVAPDAAVVTTLAEAGSTADEAGMKYDPRSNFVMAETSVSLKDATVSHTLWLSWLGARATVGGR